MSRRTKLDEIELFGSAITTTGIVVGKSTLEDVLRVHGPLRPDWKNEGYIKFSEQGVAFSFDKEQIVSGVTVFPPMMED